MRPIIGVPLRYNHLKDGRPILYLSERVRRCLQKAGGEVFVLCPVQDVDYIDTKGKEFLELTEEEKMIINKNLDKCDGLFLPGGIKFTPYDRYMLKYAIEKNIPTLGICLSMQMMSCYDEDINIEKNGVEFNHYQKDDSLLTHKVRIKNGSKLYNILGEEEILVNSFHNYHATSNHIYNVVAKSVDGLIEALEYPGSSFNMGLQWHPEISYDFDDSSKKIIDYFIRECIIFSKKRKLEKIKEEVSCN